MTKRIEKSWEEIVGRENSPRRTATSIRYPLDNHETEFALALLDVIMTKYEWRKIHGFPIFPGGML